MIRLATLAQVPLTAPKAVVRRTMDATFLNAVANHPAVRPHIAIDPSTPLDMSGLVENAANYALVTDHGGFLVVALDPGRYEVHSQFLPKGRGRHAYEAMRAGLRFMFTETDCVELVTRVPDNNAPAKSLAASAGFLEAFRRDRAWGDVGISYQSLTLDRWAGNAADLEIEGEHFHAALDDARAKLGGTTTSHPEDAAHDRAVGAAFLMFRAGQTAKGSWFYNRWAALAGYAPAVLLSHTPVVLDINDAVLTLSGGEMEVMKCR